MGEHMPRLKALALNYWPLLAGFVTLLYIGGDTVRVRQENTSLRNRLERREVPTMTIGDRIPTVAGAAAGGIYQHHSLTSGQSGFLVIGLSATCGYCQRNFDTWKRLAATARRNGVQVIWVSRDTYKVAFDAKLFDHDPSVIAAPTYSTYNRLKLGTVPQTLLTSSDGTVERVEVGVLDSREEQRFSEAIQDLNAGAREGRTEKRSSNQ